MTSTAIILDTETTGFDNPDVIQLAHSDPAESPFVFDMCHTLMFCPTKPIALGALATHHILDEELQGFPPWPGRWPLPAGVEYLIGHHVDFDWEAIGKPDVKRICTLAIARHVWPDLDSHSLGALIYYITDHREAREILRLAHSASVDIINCHRVLMRLIDATGAKTWPDLYALSERARIPERMTFGKYGPDSDWAKANGGAMRCAEVRDRDYDYYRWLFDKCDRVRDNPYLQKALRGQAA